MDNFDQITQTLRAYETDAPGVEKFIRNSILDAVDSYKPELESVRHYEQSQLPAFFDSFSGYGMGTGASDLSPTTRLANAMGEVSRQATMGMTARDILDARKARVEDLIGQTYGQWQTGYNAQQSAWQRAWQEKQAEEEKRRWEAEMALARSKAGSGGNTWGYESTDNFKEYQNYLRNIYQGGGNINPETGRTIVGMSLPGGGDLLWEIPTPASTPTSTIATKTSTPTAKTTAVSGGLSGYTAPKATAPTTSSSDFNRLVGNFMGIK